jgi:hypothetical protein
LENSYKIYFKENGAANIYVGGVVDAKALTGFERESLGGLGEKGVLWGAGAWVGKTVGKYTIE